MHQPGNRVQCPLFLIPNQLLSKGPKEDSFQCIAKSESPLALKGNNFGLTISLIPMLLFLNITKQNQPYALQINPLILARLEFPNSTHVKTILKDDPKVGTRLGQKG
eukprot:TRINITY_DN5631_c2_g1_i1.p1 TRINITY_DN5631_c2_g1~~TRINITY_DN5631_c2_g1_i1.p1  ORF type:complete len:107 (-),score=0.18 TRINITY_DN5631_c2_g1_i1:317-637(-)